MYCKEPWHTQPLIDPLDCRQDHGQMHGAAVADTRANLKQETPLHV